MAFLGLLRRREPVPPKVKLREREQPFEPKLSDDDRAEVAQRLRDGAAVDDLAEEFDVSAKTIRRVGAAAPVAAADPRQAVERAKADIQMRALKNPKYAEELEARAIDELLAGPRERPLTEVEIARVRKHLETNGFAVEPRQTVEDLRHRVADLERKLDDALKEKADLAERIVKARTGPEHWGSFAQRLIGDAAGALTTAPPAPHGASQPPVAELASKAAGAAAETAGGLALAGLRRLPPQTAAAMLLTATKTGARVGGVPLADVVPYAVGVADPDDLAAFCDGIPQVQSLAADVRRDPDWWAAMLAALRQLLGFGDPGSGAAGAGTTAEPETPTVQAGAPPAVPPPERPRPAPPPGAAAAKKPKRGKPDAGEPPAELRSSPEPPKLRWISPDSRVLIHNLANRTPGEAATWLLDQAAARAKGGQHDLDFAVNRWCTTPDADLPAVLAEMATVAPSTSGLVRWLGPQPRWWLAVVGALRERTGVGPGSPPPSGSTDDASPDAAG